MTSSVRYTPARMNPETQRMPRRSSLKLSSEPLGEDSAIERPYPRRVSFARVISVCGIEKSELQFPLSIVSDECVESPKIRDAFSSVRNSNTVEASDVSMLVESGDHLLTDVNSVTMPDTTIDTLSPLKVDESSDMSICTMKNDRFLPNMIVNDETSISPSAMTVEMSVDNESCQWMDDDVSRCATSVDICSPDVGNKLEIYTEAAIVVTPVPGYLSQAKLHHWQSGPNSSYNRRRLRSSLPALRHHANVSVSKVLSCSQPLTTESRVTTGHHAKATVSQVCLRVDGKMLSQNLANTPLRQVTPRDWIHAIHRSGDPTFGEHTNRFHPKCLMPSVNRLQSHTLRLASCPLHEIQVYNFGMTSKSLEEFLAHHPPSTLDTNDTLIPSFPDNLKNVKELWPEVYTQLANERQFMESVFRKRIAQYIHTWEVRRSGILLLSQSNLLPVVEQLSKMTTSELADFFAPAHEQLYVCEQSAKREIQEIQAQNLSEFQNEQTWECERLHEVEIGLDKELTSLTQQLELLNTYAKDKHEMEKYLRETLKRLDAIDVVHQEVRETIQNLQNKNLQFDGELKKLLPIRDDPTHVHNGIRGCTIGATPLYVPWDICSARRRQTVESEDAVEVNKDELINLLTPCAIDCISLEKHTYSFRTLFGLLLFTVNCDTVPSADIAEPNEIVPLEWLIVSSIECCTPPKYLAPAECPALESLADYLVQFFNSRDGRSQLCSRLFGMSLDKALKHVEYILSPYLLLAADLRAVYLAEHEVEFDAFLPLDITLLSSTQKNVCPTPSLFTLTDKNRSRSGPTTDHCSLDRILPSGPINVSVTIFNREVRAVVSLSFTFASIESDRPSTANSVEVIFGHIDCEKFKQLMNSSKVFVGCLHRIVRTLNEALASLSKK